MGIKYYDTVGFMVFFGNYDLLKPGDKQVEKGQIYCHKCFGKFNHISWDGKAVYERIQADSKLAHTGLKCSECGAKIPEYTQKATGYAIDGKDDHWIVRCPACDREYEYQGFLTRKMSQFANVELNSQQKKLS